jgi:DNA-binding transcriptional MerR regulator
MRYYDTTSTIQLPQKQSGQRLYANVADNQWSH